MALFKVTIDLNSISYEIEAESENKAIELAQDCFYEEKSFDIIKWANYLVSELEVGE